VFVFLLTLFFQLGADVARQFVAMLVVAAAWEFEKQVLDLHPDEHSTFAELVFLVTGLITGAITVLIWPYEQTAQSPFHEISAIASPIITGFTIYATRYLIRQTGTQPSEFLSFRPAVLFALGVSLTRTVMLSDWI